MDDKFDVIVVGAGLAGCAAAYKLVKEGLSVVVIERGQYSGSKNLSGGVLRSLQDMEIHKTRIAVLTMIKRLYFAFCFIFGLFPGSTRYFRVAPAVIAGSLAVKANGMVKPSNMLTIISCAVPASVKYVLMWRVHGIRFLHT